MCDPTKRAIAPEILELARAIGRHIAREQLEQERVSEEQPSERRSSG